MASIRAKYLPGGQGQPTHLEQIRKLDAKVEGRAMVTALTEGIIFTLILGLGMTCVLVWNLPVIGVLLGLVGLGGALYQKVLKKERAKAAPEILRLSENE